MAEPERDVSQPSTHSSMSEMATLWVQSQSIVSAYITANVIDLHHAEDLIQDVAKAVAERFDTFDRSRPFTPWVLGIARNRLLKYYRSRARDRLVLSEPALASYGDAMHRIEQEAEDRRHALRTCLKQITGRSREILDLRYGADLKVKEIGLQLGISASTVSVVLHRVRRALDECIRRTLATEGGDGAQTN